MEALRQDVAEREKQVHTTTKGYRVRIWVILGVGPRPRLRVKVACLVASFTH